MVVSRMPGIEGPTDCPRVRWLPTPTTWSSPSTSRRWACASRATASSSAATRPSARCSATSPPSSRAVAGVPVSVARRVRAHRRAGPAGDAAHRSLQRRAHHASPQRAPLLVPCGRSLAAARTTRSPMRCGCSRTSRRAARWRVALTVREREIVRQLAAGQSTQADRARARREPAHHRRPPCTHHEEGRRAKRQRDDLQAGRPALRLDPGRYLRQGQDGREAGPGRSPRP